MQEQQIKAIGCLIVIGGVLGSILVPALLLAGDVKSDLVLGIFAPGLALFPVVHMPLLGGLLIVTFNGIIYASAAYGIARLVMRRLDKGRGQ